MTTQVNRDVYEILEALKKVEGNEGKDDAELVREGIYQLFLKYAEDKDTGILDLVLVGDIDPYHLNDLSRKTERYIKRKIRPLVVSRNEYKELLPKLKDRPRLLIWQAPDKKSSELTGATLY